MRTGDGVLNLMTYGTSVIGTQFTGEEFNDQAAFTGFAVMQCALFTFKSPAEAQQSSFLQLGLGSGIVPSWIRAHGKTVRSSARCLMIIMIYAIYHIQV